MVHIFKNRKCIHNLFIMSTQTVCR